MINSTKPESPKKRRIASVGEVLWDIFPSGPRFGGAPANFACTVAGLSKQGTAVSMVSCIGRDELGIRALQSLRHHGVDTSAVFSGEYPTGEVHVKLDRAGSATYEFAENSAWDHLVWSEQLAILASEVDAIYFGTLGQRSPESRKTIQRLLRHVSNRALRVLDVNLRPPFFDDKLILDSLDLANVVKLNDEELPVLAAMFGLAGDERSVLKQLAARFELKAVAFTRGSNGAIVLRDAQFHESDGVEAKVADTVGAGDAFTAAFVIGLLNDNPLDLINRSACEIAAYVCAHEGATPEIPRTMASLFTRASN